MEFSEGESDAESELGEENEVSILPPKYMARERRIQRLRSLNLHLPGRTHQEGQSLSEKELEYIDDRIRQKGGKSVRKIGMVKEPSRPATHTKHQQWRKHGSDSWRDMRVRYSKPE